VGCPVGNYVIGCPGYQHLHIYSTGRCRLESAEQGVIRYEVGAGKKDMMLGVLDAVEVHVAYRKGQPECVGTPHNELVIIAARLLAHDVPLLRSIPIPEIGECSSQMHGRWPRDAQVGVTPLGGIELAQVVSANEGDTVIHYQELAVIKSIAARIEQVPRPA